MLYKKPKQANTSKLLLMFCGLFLLVTVALTAVAFLTKKPSLPPKEDVPAISDNAEDEDRDSSEESENEEEDPEGEDSLEDEDMPVTEDIVFNKPSAMRGVYLNPSKEFTATSSEETIKSQIDKAINKAVEFNMNTIIVDLFSKDGTVFNLDSIKSASSFDTLSYILDKAEEEGLYVYTIYDLSAVADGDDIRYLDAIEAKSTDSVLGVLNSFVKKYDVDAVMLKGYYNPNSDSSYGEYIQNGGGEGLKNYLKSASEGIIVSAKNTVKSVNPSVQVGLLAEHPWANTSEDDDGSKTITAFTSNYDGNADTKKFIENGYADFLAIEAFGAIGDATENFEVITSWWNDVTSESEVPMYVVHASEKAVSQASGWNAPDQLTRQALYVKGLENVEGSMFNSLNRLIENPSNSTNNLMEFYQDKLKPEHILKELALTSPSALTGTTYEKTITFKGASDPNFDVLFDGKKLDTDQNGYFTITKDLKVGANQFKIEHKGKTLNYKFTRSVQVLKDVSPVGSVNVDGGMTVTVSASAYADANVYAVINGQTIPMTINDEIEGDVIGDTSYKTFEGTFKAPAATTSTQSLGNIVVYGKWSSVSESRQGAAVTVNKKPVLENGVMIKVTEQQAETFPTNELNDNSNPSFYPLPAGTLDYAVGDEMVFKTTVEGQARTYRYYNLSSGLRVYSEDITPVSAQELGDNKISGLTVDANKQFTDVIFATAQKVPFVAKYDGSSFNIKFEYTKTVTDNLSLNKNPLFSGANWSGTTLKLSLRNSGVFLGYRSFYDSNGNLVFRFNNPTTLAGGAHITVDPGHDVTDPGSLGFNPNIPEQMINWDIGQNLAEELRDRGANVNLIKSGRQKYTLKQRLASAKQHNSILYMSVHNNYASSDAKGSEVYYFNNYSKPLAATSAKKVSSALSTTNRGGRFGYFFVTRDTQFPAVLVECGFLTNKSEYNKLKDEDYQMDIAAALADSIDSTLKSLSMDAGITGTQSVGNSVDVGDVPEDEEVDEEVDEKIDDEENENTDEKDEETEDKDTDKKIKLKDMYFATNTIKMDVGEKINPTIVFKPNNATNKKLQFKSDDKKIATVSSTGQIKAIREGECEIVAISDDGDFRDSCTVIVSGNSSSSNSTDVSSVKFKEKNVQLALDQTYQLKWEIRPASAKDTKVYFESSNEKCVTVDKSGVITGKRFGEATITITTRDGDYTNTCTVTVDDSEVEPNGVEILDDSIIMQKRDRYTLSYEVTPSNAADKGVEFYSDDTSVCDIDAKGKITAYDEGTAKITVLTDVGQYKDSIYVTVKDKLINVTSVSISNSSLNLQRGEKAKLSATVSPKNADEKGIIWKSEDSDVVIINQDGELEAVGSGTVEILAVSKDSSKKAYCTVTVE